MQGVPEAIPHGTGCNALQQRHIPVQVGLGPLRANGCHIKPAAALTVPEYSGQLGAAL